MNNLISEQQNKTLRANKPVGSAERVKLKPLASVVLLKKHCNEIIKKQNMRQHSYGKTKIAELPAGPQSYNTNVCCMIAWH